MTIDTQDPFQVVLVDIQQAANGRIHCIQAPLTSDLQYIAISYRWGELQEKLVDTNVGYTASVTSFRLEHFCQLCRSINDIPYVWVDALCVDQTNYERRKATIHHMSSIYEHATYILAIPDLHLQYLKNVFTSHRDIIARAAPFRKDIYYLLHRRYDDLEQLEQERMDFYGVPKDKALRHMLTQYTDCFTLGLTRFREHGGDYNPEEILDHLYDSTLPTHPSDSPEPCHDTCPFNHFTYDKTAPRVSAPDRSGRNRTWKQQIYDRSNVIRTAIHFLSDLVVEWSSRAWVVSEFSIAKKKNNLKYWFIQLNGPDIEFFPFDFNDPHVPAMPKRWKSASSEPVQFQHTMSRQLKDQTFLEMILKSKATRDEDRFYAVLPVSKYKHKLGAITNTTNTLAVKLQLYDWMDTKDKLTLVFLSCYRKVILDTTLILPTFATPTIYWPSSADCFVGDHLNFDLTTPVQFKHDGLYSLHLAPFGYYVYDGPQKDSCQDFLLEKPALCNQVGLEAPFDVVAIPNIVVGTSHRKPFWLHLIGNFATNKWVFDKCTLTCSPASSDWTFHTKGGFTIY